MKRILIVLAFVPFGLFAQTSIDICDLHSTVYAYMSTPATTTTTDAATYYYLQGTFTNETMKNFDVVSDTLTYQGLKGCGLLLFTGTFKADTNDTEITVCVKKNGVVETNSEMTMLIESANKSIGAVAIVDNLCLNPSDRISLWIKSDKAGAVITPVKVNTTIWVR